MTSKKQETMNEATKCAICWEDIGDKNISVMNCGHSFHFSCITSNILKGSGDHSMNCPLCRELIVDKEFEDKQIRLFQYDSDNDSIPELEEEILENNSIWSGSQMWRRDLNIRDKVKITVEMDTIGEMLNGMGWDIKDDEIITYEYEDRRGVINCEVVCVIDQPLEGMAPFLVKPVDGRNRLQLQAYQPKQEEVLSIDLLHIGSNFDDFELERYEREEILFDEMQRDAIIQFNRTETIAKRQIHDKPIHEIMETIDEKIKNIDFRNETYNVLTIRSVVHKITMDLLMDHKREQERDIMNVNFNT